MATWYGCDTSHRAKTHTKKTYVQEAVYSISKEDLYLNMKLNQTRMARVDDTVGERQMMRMDTVGESLA